MQGNYSFRADKQSTLNTPDSDTVPNAPKEQIGGFFRVENRRRRHGTSQVESAVTLLQNVDATPGDIDDGDAKEELDRKFCVQHKMMTSRHQAIRFGSDENESTGVQ